MSEGRFTVNMLPIWEDCPWRDKIPEILTIRCGVVPGFEQLQVAICAPGNSFHIDFEKRDELDDASVRHIVSSLLPKKMKYSAGKR